MSTPSTNALRADVDTLRPVLARMLALAISAIRFRMHLTASSRRAPDSAAEANLSGLSYSVALIQAHRDYGGFLAAPLFVCNENLSPSYCLQHPLAGEWALLWSIPLCCFARDLATVATSHRPPQNRIHPGHKEPTPNTCLPRPLHPHLLTGPQPHRGATVDAGTQEATGDGEQRAGRDEPYANPTLPSITTLRQVSPLLSPAAFEETEHEEQNRGLSLSPDSEGSNDRFHASRSPTYPPPYTGGSHPSPVSRTSDPRNYTYYGYTYPAPPVRAPMTTLRPTHSWKEGEPGPSTRYMSSGEDVASQRRSYQLYPVQAPMPSSSSAFTQYPVAGPSSVGPSRISEGLDNEFLGGYEGRGSQHPYPEHGYSDTSDAPRRREARRLVHEEFYQRRPPSYQTPGGTSLESPQASSSARIPVPPDLHDPRLEPDLRRPSSRSEAESPYAGAFPYSHGKVYWNPQRVSLAPLRQVSGSPTSAGAWPAAGTGTSVEAASLRPSRHTSVDIGGDDSARVGEDSDFSTGSREKRRAGALTAAKINPRKRAHSVSSSEDETTARRSKKTEVACNFCRQRKLRCNGKKPSCRNCDRRNTPCVYADGPKRRGPGKAPKGAKKSLAARERAEFLARAPPPPVPGEPVPQQTAIFPARITFDPLLGEAPTAIQSVDPRLTVSAPTGMDRMYLPPPGYSMETPEGARRGRQRKRMRTQASAEALTISAPEEESSNDSFCADMAKFSQDYPPRSP
ncbi:hypothetical protein A0H81_08438 [Grifola frondosa]|uniref:Zn(2)-C6 fungal-type domain-containing protein n=1 Tax=Grifola frondosa TaxID=5627 RepID=A0A1C7M3S4_GRIFR|nr:hypothetical protein A0H81_08438 [Grifola frondosa]